jgi:uncharacterized protein
MKKINKTALFLILVFSISFSFAGLFKLLGGDISNQLAYTLMGATYMFIPTICVLIVEKLIHKQPLQKNLLISFKINKWFVIAWLSMPILAFITIGVSLLFPDVIFTPDMAGLFKRYEAMLNPEQLAEMKASLETLPMHPILLTLLQGLFAGITINAVAAFGEELGWRGFLLKAFKEMSFLKASVIIGFIWGVWHSPLILMGHNYPQHPQIGVLMMTIWCILLTPLFLYITIKAKSVIAAAILHGTMNATAGISIMVISGGNDLTVGVTGLAGFISVFAIFLAVFFYDHKVSKENIMTKKVMDSL